MLETGDIPVRQARELAPLLKKSTPEVVRQVYTEVLEEAGDPVKVTAAARRPPIDPKTRKDEIRMCGAGAAHTYTAMSLTEFLGWDARTIRRCLDALDAEAEGVVDTNDLGGVPPTVAEEIISVARETARRESKLARSVG